MLRPGRPFSALRRSDSSGGGTQAPGTVGDQTQRLSNSVGTHSNLILCRSFPYSNCRNAFPRTCPDTSGQAPPVASEPPLLSGIVIPSGTRETRYSQALSFRAERGSLRYCSGGCHSERSVESLPATLDLNLLLETGNSTMDTGRPGRSLPSPHFSKHVILSAASQTPSRRTPVPSAAYQLLTCILSQILPPLSAAWTTPKIFTAEC